MHCTGIILEKEITLPLLRRAFLAVVKGTVSREGSGFFWYFALFRSGYKPELVFNVFEAP